MITVTSSLMTYSPDPMCGHCCQSANFGKMACALVDHFQYQNLRFIGWRQQNHLQSYLGRASDNCRSMEDRLMSEESSCPWRGLKGLRPGNF